MFSTDSLMISSLFYMRYVCVTVLIQFIKEMTISERTFIQKSTESNITNCKFLQSNITSYILLLRKVACYIT